MLTAAIAGVVDHPCIKHRSLEMTLVYAKITDRVVADAYASVCEQIDALYATANTPGALPAEIETAAMARLRQESHARMLGNGMCTRLVELDCRMETICETAPKRHPLDSDPAYNAGSETLPGSVVSVGSNSQRGRTPQDSRSRLRASVHAGPATRLTAATAATDGSRSSGLTGLVHWCFGPRGLFVVEPTALVGPNGDDLLREAPSTSASPCGPSGRPPTATRSATRARSAFAWVAIDRRSPVRTVDEWSSGPRVAGSTSVGSGSGLAAEERTAKPVAGDGRADHRAAARGPRRNPMILTSPSRLTASRLRSAWLWRSHKARTLRCLEHRLQPSACAPG